MNHPHPELGTPSKLVAGGLRIVALGGLAEIGRNMTVFETNGKLLIVDCGVLFPEENQPGIDLILPDFSYIRDRLDDVVGLVLTHGHEDHIGATPYLLRERGGAHIKWVRDPGASDGRCNLGLQFDKHQLHGGGKAATGGVQRFRQLQLARVEIEPAQMAGHHFERQSAHGDGVAGAQPFYHRRVEIGAAADNGDGR